MGINLFSCGIIQSGCMSSSFFSLFFFVSYSILQFFKIFVTIYTHPKESGGIIILCSLSAIPAGDSVHRYGILEQILCLSLPGRG